jgi:hypothetical protein
MELKRRSRRRKKRMTIKPKQKFIESEVVASANPLAAQQNSNEKKG